MDNAKNNTMMIKSLMGIFHSHDIPFDTKEQQVFCFPHTTNICTGHIISSLTSALHNQEPSDNHTHSGDQTYEQALACNPIAVAHAAIHGIWVSGACQEAFVAVIRDGNKYGCFKDPLTGNTIILRLLQLLQDVPTQWDSVYYMIHWFSYLHPLLTHSNRLSIIF